MSWQATAWAERQTTGSPSRKALLLVMANYADQDGFCWPSQETLAAGAEISLDTVQRQSKKLHEMELIKIERLPKRRGQWQGFCYRLDLSKETRPPKPAKPQFAARPVRSNPAEFGKTASSVPNEPSIQPIAAAAAVSGDSAPAAGDVSGTVSPTRSTRDAERPEGSSSGPHMRLGHAASLRPGQAAMGSSTEPQSLRPKPSLEPSIEYSSEPSRANLPTNAADRMRAFQGKQESFEVVQHRIAQRLGSKGWLILQEMSPAKMCRLTTLERRGELDDATLQHAAAATRLAQPP